MKKICLLMLAATLLLSGCSNNTSGETNTETGTFTTSNETEKTPETTPGSSEKESDATAQSTSAPVETPEKTEQKGETDMKSIVTMKTVTVDKTDAKKPVVTIEMMSGGVIKAELYPDVAPITVENFISLIEKGFYNGLTFHRNIPGFVIQGGCPNGTGTGGPGYQIKGEFASNGFENNLKHTRGVLSMARAMHPDSAGSQFFIMHADAPHLDGDYAAFGMVTEGMEVVDQIANS